MSNQSSIQRTVPEVMDMESGRIFDVSEIFSRSDREHHLQRMNDEVARIRGGNVRYFCPLCHAALLIRASPNRSYFFRHPNDPQAKCPYRYDNQLTPEQINAIKYDGARESGRHRQIKRMLQKSLNADEGVDAESVMIEKTIRNHEGDWTQWRRPDVQARFSGLRIAFEIQLSTTFLTVIAGRREFYLRNGGLLFWIFDELFLDSADMRFTERDVFYNNNSNLFYLTNTSVERSIQAQACKLMCRWQVPTLVNGEIVHQWNEKEVSLLEVTFDLKRQRAYYFDYEAQLRKVNQDRVQWQAQQEAKQRAEQDLVEAMQKAAVFEHARQLEARRAAEAKFASNRRDRLQGFVRYADQVDESELTAKDACEKRERFHRSVLGQYCMPPPPINTSENFGNYFIRGGIESDPAPYQQVVWEYYWEELSDRTGSQSIRLPRIMPADLRVLLCALYSLWEGCIIGTGHQDLRALENDLFENYRWFYLPFVYGIQAFARERETGILEEGSAAKRHTLQYRANKGRLGYVQNGSYNSLIKYLFPPMT